MQYKLTKKLFYGTYQYKIVLICAGASLFRSNDLDAVLENLKQFKNTFGEDDRYLFFKNRNVIRTKEDLDYALKLQHTLSLLTDFDLRIESPWVNVYTNSKAAVNKLCKIDKSKVKYISEPPVDSTLAVDTIILPKINFDYRVTVGRTSQDCTAFVQWAGTNSKLKLTKSCTTALSKPRSWGGSYFYITGDNNLLMAKMHLGGCISKVERIIKDKA
jgi:hypothetical protein